MSIKNLSLKFKLTALSLGMLTLLGGTSWFILNSILRQTESELLGQFKSQADNLNDHIAAQFFERYGDVQAFAISPVWTEKDKSKMVDMLNQWTALYGIYDLIMFTDRQGNLIAVNDRGPDGKSIKSGSLYAKNFARDKWFTSALSGSFTEDKNKGFMGTSFEDVNVDPYISQTLGKKSIATSFSAQVKNAQGEVIGVISTRASARWFEGAFQEVYSSLKDAGFGHSRMVLLSKDGTLLYQFAAEGAEGNEADQMFRLNYVEKGVASAADATQGKSGALYEVDPLLNEEVITGYTPVNGKKFPEAIGWSILVSDEKTEGLANIVRAQRIFYFFFGLIMLVSFFGMHWFSRQLASQLAIVASKLSDGSAKLAENARGIAASSTQLSAASTEQAAAIQETAASIDEVSAMVKKSAENAALSQKTSTLSRDAAERGRTEVENMTSAIEKIYASNTAIMNQVDDGNKKISEIVKVIGEIGDKTKVINDIVFQTKLLSFNASVEAARAGEHGKGFAVVAEEVGNLAQMSGNAAKEISQLLEESIRKVESIVSETQSKVGTLIVENKEKIELGTEVSRRCGEALTQILGCVGEVDTMVQEISGSSQEQAQGVLEINKAINQLDTVTQQNSMVAQTTSVTAQSIDRESTIVKSLVDELTLLVHGKTNATQATPRGLAQKQASTKPEKKTVTKTTEPTLSRSKPAPLAKSDNVVALRRKEASPAPTSSAVKTQASTSSEKSETPRKFAKAASASKFAGNIPSADDSRFEDL